MILQSINHSILLLNYSW
uniref:Uncharacterized protein n=1 Tax=Anguilla anguilla TaxID=7936 RepID=A0A0E9V1V9_ANGAN